MWVCPKVGVARPRCVPDGPALPQHLRGRHVLHPFTGRRLPVLHDAFVDPQFGTGEGRGRGGAWRGVVI